MLTVFIEYKIPESEMNNYIKEMRKVKAELGRLGISQHEWLQAADQPGLFVERLNIEDKELYVHWKKEIETDASQSLWAPIFPYIQGGLTKFNMWAFKNVHY